MTKLKVNCRGQILFEIVLDPNRQYTAGRRDGCDISLQNEKGISREHFTITRVNEVWVVDLLSRYGDLIYHGEETKQIKLQNEDLFLVPPFEFIVFTQNVSGSEEMVSSNYSGDPKAGPLEDVSDKTFVRTVQYTPYIRSIEPATGKRNLIQLGVGNTWIAGRDSGCSIHIRDTRVSRRQFEIQQIGDNYYILDLGSVNGTMINGTPVSSSEPILLKSGDIIAVLDNHFYFELHDSEFQSQLESAAQLPAVINPIEVPQVPNVNIPISNPHAYHGNEVANYEPTMVVDNFEGEADEESESQSHYHDESPTPAPPKKNKNFYIVLAIVILVFAYLLSERPKVAPTPAPTKEGSGQLSTAQKAKLQQTYNLAKNLYIQQKYQLAASELDKVSDISKDLPEFNELRQFVNEALVLNDQLRRKENEEQNRKEIEEKIVSKIEECKKLINPNITEQQIDDCLSTVIALGPEHPGISELKQKAAQIESVRLARASQKADYEASVQRFQKFYAKSDSSASQSIKSGDLLAAIATYDKVLVSNLPDPGNLKNSARQKISNLKKELSQKVNSAMASSEKLFGNHEYKKAILLLRNAQKVDPENVDLQDKINKGIGELRKEMMGIYQEGVLEESFGNVDGSENRPGAKDKWKKILELDISDGEYYRKAQMKLKKYGAI